MIKTLVILGPTAVGKSDLAVDLAEKFDGEIISADSRQVYKGMDIGTGKITLKEMHGIRHYLLDIADPKDQFSVADFVKLGGEAISTIHKKGKLPIICGGTGFYISALIDGIVLPEVPADPNLRSKLEKKSKEELLLLLTQLDPERAKTIDKENPRRLIRAIEIATALGSVPNFTKNKTDYDPLFIGLTTTLEDLKNRIEMRLEKRLNGGMIEEAERLHDEGLSFERMDELGLEYRYLAMYLQKKISLDEMKEKLATEIWHYAKRQMTWFKKDTRIQWFDVKDKGQINGSVKGFLRT